MLNIGAAFQSERTIKAVIGVNIEEFNKLLPKFAEELEKERLSTASLPTSSRAPGAGRKHTLREAKEKLFYILFYLKCYPTYDLAGLCFDVDRSQACRWVEELLPMLRKVLAQEQVLPLRGSLSDDVISYLFQDVTELYLDGTERPVQRPVEHEQQKACYSGKKKRHTRKHLILNDERKRVLILIGTYEGKKHDYAIFKNSRIAPLIPEQCNVFVDLGFQGIETDYPKLSVLIPFKKPKGGMLSQVEKNINHLIAQLRVLSENTIAGIKRLRCVTDIFRNKRSAMADTFMELACGIWNFHIEMCAKSLA